MLLVEDLKKMPDYQFELNMSDEYKDADDCSTDEWGCATVWLGEDQGAEYNFCLDCGENFSAIYKMEPDEASGDIGTDHDTFIHYEVDFSHENWREKLENAMCDALIIFFEL